MKGPAMSEKTSASPNRITAVDQLRGYAIFGMLLVNASGYFNFKTEQISHHKDWYSYADTIAPLFLFVVGMGMRLSWLNRAEKVGHSEARWAMAKRFTVLVLIGFTIYGGWLWDALTDIGLAGLLALFLIDRKPAIRIGAAFAYLGIYQAMYSWTIYGEWVRRTISFTGDDAAPVPLLIRAIPQWDQLFAVSLNGGPLGPLSWVMMLLFGSLAYDLLAARDEKKFIIGCLAWGIGLCIAGHIIHIPWGEAKPEWPNSAYHMTAPFPLWSTGLCFLTLLAFYLICDKIGFEIPTFTALGMNPLFIYILQSLLLSSMGAFPIEGLTPTMGIVYFALFYAAIAGLAWWMKQRNIFVKI
jgi:predicted acyltransferase